ncbi:MAG: hypothetical protein IPP50_06710 [Piscinibacter sp.]|nr:hypothetical protein [Piscinibacter sp.]
MKVAVSSQKARSRSASCSVASSAASWARGGVSCVGVPRNAQACSGATITSRTAPMTASAPRQSNSASSQATAGNDSVLAKPPTSVSEVMPWRYCAAKRLVSTLKAGSYNVIAIEAPSSTQAA